MGLTPAKRPVALMSAPELPEGRYETWPVSRRKHLALLADDYSMPFATHAADGAMPLLSAEGWRRRHAHGWLMLPRAQPLPARGAALKEDASHMWMMRLQLQREPIRALHACSASPWCCHAHVGGQEGKEQFTACCMPSSCTHLPGHAQLRLPPLTLGYAPHLPSLCSPRYTLGLIRSALC